MDTELSALEERIRQTIDLCQRLRIENTELRQQLASVQNENKRLTDKIGSARDRLEALLRQIPE